MPPIKKKDAPTYGPHNPHPFSEMRTELVWEGKYDEYGNKRRDRRWLFGDANARDRND